MRHCKQRARRHLKPLFRQEREGRRRRDDLQVRRPASKSHLAPRFARGRLVLNSGHSPPFLLPFLQRSASTPTQSTGVFRC
jgi:hypothetical protein